MTHGYIEAMYIAPAKGAPMQAVDEVEAVAGAGLRGDRYSTGEGSWNNGKQGVRQVTFINSQLIKGTGFIASETRRNIITNGVELMSLIGQEFNIGEAIFKGIKYCYVCDRPTHLLDRGYSFCENLSDRGGLIAEVVRGGIIKINSEIIT